MSELDKLIALRKASAEKIAELTASRKAITDEAEARGEEHSDLTEDEAEKFRSIREDLKAERARFDDLDSQVTDEEAEIERSGRQNKRTAEIAKGTVAVTDVKEPLTYQRGSGKSYFRDLAQASVGMADESAKERLRRHGVDVATDQELRKLAKVGDEFRNLDRNDGSGGYAVPPLWLMNQFIELARPGRTYANLPVGQPLPANTDSINIPKIASGTSTLIQTADNATIAEHDLTDTSVRANVTTIAGQQGVSIQLLDQSPVAFDELVFRDLAADYATKVDLQVIGGTGANNQVTGVRNTAGISTIAATAVGGTSNVALVYAAIANAIQKVHTTRYLAPEVIAMHPRRWAWFLAANDSTGRPLVTPYAPSAFNPNAEFGGVVSQQVVGDLQGLPVVTDPNLPTNVGAGTNQDVIHVLRASDLVLFESSTRARALQETRADGLTILLQIYGYLAFTAGRFPQSVVEVTGTALTTPLFDGLNG